MESSPFDMNCVHLPEIGYGEFSSRVYDRLKGRRIPLAGSIELTWRCNLRCAHCYINLPAADAAARQEELDLPAWQRLIDELVAAGCLWLLLTGGEPLLCPYFLDIYTYAKARGMLITLFTNGTLVTPAIARQLAAWRPLSVEVTVYGATQATYEAVTQVPGSFQKCRNGIQLLVDHLVPLTLKTMVMTLNRHELEAMRNWAQELGVNFRYDAILQPRLDGSHDVYDLRIPPEQVVELDLTDAKRFKEWQLFLERSVDSVYNVKDMLFDCGAGLNSFHIDPYGYLSPCLMARRQHYNLALGNFKEGWYEFILEIRNRKRRKETPCSHCRLSGFCDQCPGWSQVEHGDDETVVDYLCQIAHLRAKAFGYNPRENQEDKNDPKKAISKA